MHGYMNFTAQVPSQAGSTDGLEFSGKGNVRLSQTRVRDLRAYLAKHGLLYNDKGIDIGIDMVPYGKPSPLNRAGWSGFANCPAVLWSQTLSTSFEAMHSPAFSLQRMSAGQAVDWDAVDDELDKIPPELKDPRFDSLRHVLNILSAVDAEAALEEVRLPAQAGC